SGSGTTCIVGPNGCGKSNVVDAISWVLGEQSHKSLRAERMADCIFNGTSKRPPLGLAEVTITMEDPELAEAARFVMESAASDSATTPVTENSENSGSTDATEILSLDSAQTSETAEEAAGVTKFKTKKRLAEAKLESSKVNLARVNDIVVEVEKQLGSLKRQAAKARRYSEIRDQMRGIVRQMLAGKARELDAEAERI